MLNTPEAIGSPRSPRKLLVWAGIAAIAIGSLVAAKRDAIQNMLGMNNAPVPKDVTKGPEEKKKNDIPDNADGVTKANAFLRSLPDALPNGAAVEKYEVQGAKWVIVDIGMAHKRPPMSEERLKNIPAQKRVTLRAVEARVNQFWKEQCIPDLENTLGHMQAQYGMRTIHVESFTQEDATATLASIGELGAIYRGLPKNHPTAVKILTRVREDFGAWGPMALENTLTVVAAENAELLDRVQQEMLKAQPNTLELERDHLVRERVAVEMMGANPQGGDVRYIYFGDWHSFDEAQKAYNKAHPENACSRVRIRPKTVMELPKMIDREIDKWAKE